MPNASLAPMPLFLPTASNVRAYQQQVEVLQYKLQVSNYGSNGILDCSCRQHVDEQCSFALCTASTAKHHLGLCGSACRKWARRGMQPTPSCPSCARQQQHSSTASIRCVGRRMKCLLLAWAFPEKVCTGCRSCALQASGFAVVSVRQRPAATPLPVCMPCRPAGQRRQRAAQGRSGAGNISNQLRTLKLSRPAGQRSQRAAQG